MYKSQPTILITGASGFIGSHLVDAAVLKGYVVYCAIRAWSSKEFLQHPLLSFVVLDYSNPAILKEQINAIEGLRYIVHCAGITKSSKPGDFDKVNHQYTANLIDAVNQSDHSISKFILMSSLSVMGEGDEIYFTPFDSKSIPTPNTLYGKSKLKAEEYLASSAHFPYIILRPTGVYGPRERDYLMAIRATNGGLALKVGKKAQQLTFIYVKDLAEATFLALESGENEKAYFISDGYTYTDDEFQCLIKKNLNKSRVMSIKVPLFVVKSVAAAGHFLSFLLKRSSTLNLDKYKILKQRNWRCDISPIVLELRFEPKYTLDEGLKDAIGWYKANEWM